MKTCDAILLACTHYPAVAKQIQNILPGCKLLDPAATVAGHIKKNWKLTDSSAKKKPSTLFLTSGDAEQMKKAAKAAFRIHIFRVLKV